jgi:hypothetical protein
MSTLETRRDDFSHFIPGNAKGSNQALYKKCHVDATRRQNFGQMHTYVDLSKHHQAIRRTSVEVIGVRTTFQYPVPLHQIAQPSHTVTPGHNRLLGTGH